MQLIASIKAGSTAKRIVATAVVAAALAATAFIPAGDSLLADAGRKMVTPPGAPHGETAEEQASDHITVLAKGRKMR